MPTEQYAWVNSPLTLFELQRGNRFLLSLAGKVYAGSNVAPNHAVAILLRKIVKADGALPTRKFEQTTKIFEELDNHF